MIKRDPGCTRCRLCKTAEYVCLLGKGPEPCEVAIVGEAPGACEDDTGEPFVGAAGKLLTRLLDEAGLDRRDIFITNAVSCRPPDNKTPTDSQIDSCNYWLNGQLRSVKPKYVLLLGNVPLYAITGEKGISKARGKPFEQDGVIYLPTFHPAYALRYPEAEYTIGKDLALFAKIIEQGQIPRERSLKFFVIDTELKLKRFVKRLRHRSVTFDIETTGLFPWMPNGRVNTLQFDIKDKQWIIFLTSFADPAAVVKMIDEAVQKHDVQFTAHNGKFDFLWMLVHFGVRWYERFQFDTMLAHYLLDENSLHGLKFLAQHFLGAPDWDVDKDTKKGKYLTTPEGRHKLALYGAHDVYYTTRLKKIFLRRLRQEPEVYRVFRWILMPAAQMYVEAEFYGAPVNVERLDEVGKELHKRKDEAEQELLRYGDINWGSAQQVSKRLFEDLRIPIVERTKGGAASTSESVLKRIDHPAVGALLRFRECKQQLSFFIEGWEPYLVDGWLHPSFKLHGTVTGRLSCENPNLQQVPRDENIRSIITAIPHLHGDWVLVEADLSQIELRIAAELAGAKSLRDCFVNGTDVHWLTALTEIRRGKGKKELIAKTARELGCKSSRYDDQVDSMLAAGPDRCIEIEHGWKELRKKAKAVNFGYLFGMWWTKFKIYARDNYGVHVTDQQAEESRENFFMLYPELDAWQRRQKTMARFNGFVQSLSGRKRRLPHATNKNHKDPRRKEAERQAINSPVQSFANELNLMAALQLRKEFDRDTVRIIGTVHDSTLFLVRTKDVQRVCARYQEIMRWPKLLDKFKVKFKVPLEGEVKIGAWGRGVSPAKWTSPAGSQSTLVRKKGPSRSQSATLKAA